MRCTGMQLPAFENVHMLSVSREAITAVSISPRGDWVALGCAALGQLLVWEWRSESYVLKQQGHHYDVSALAFSPDGSYIATGADDNKVRWCLLTSAYRRISRDISIGWNVLCRADFTAHPSARRCLPLSYF